RVSHAPDRYRQSGSSNRAVERAHWSVDGTLQNAPERPRLAPRTSHDGEPASWPARLPEEVRLGTVQNRYFQARHPQIAARPAPCRAGSRLVFQNWVSRSREPQQSAFPTANLAYAYPRELRTGVHALLLK